MAPLRRYLRITPYSILEVRIYLDNPADLNRWLLHPSHPILPSILASVKPLILPKLREENARASGRKLAATGAKPKGKKVVRDVISTDEFEVSIFLTELSTPHSVLVRTREFTASAAAATTTTSGSGSGTKEVPITVPEEDARSHSSSPVSGNGSGDKLGDRSEDKPGDSSLQKELTDSRDKTGDQASGEADIDAISIASDADEDEDEEEGEEKKKLALKTRYDGFQIYGRILCLVVKRKDQPKQGQQQQRVVGVGTGQRSQSGNDGQESIADMVSRQATMPSKTDSQGQGIMEGWMRSTQA